MKTAWPTRDPGLSRAQRLDLQKLLIKNGYDIGEADGRIGPITMAAIKKAGEEVRHEADRPPGNPDLPEAGRQVMRMRGPLGAGRFRIRMGAPDATSPGASA